MYQKVRTFMIIVLPLFFLISCSFNPFISNNHTTGSVAGAAVGASAGVGTAAAMHGSKPLLALGGITGGMLGYYVTTLRYDSADILNAGGNVYKVGDYVGIYIPSDKLFEPNTAYLKPCAACILDSAATVLKRYPNNNIIISGNTSGFYRDGWEQRLSEARAKVVSAYLWNAGISNFKDPTNNLRKLNYVGYGDYFPIASDLTNKGIRANSRIQIVSYPTFCDLLLDKRNVAMRNMGSTDDTYIEAAPIAHCREVDCNGRCLGVDP